METKTIFTVLITVIICCLVSKMCNKIKSYKSKKRPRSYPYAQKYLLTKTEYNFYKILYEYAVENDLLICPKVRMEDFLRVTDRKNYAKYRGYIKSRHIDFLLCDSSLHLLCGLELDDSSHNNPDAQATDNFKDNVFKAIHLPLFRIKTTSNYEDEVERIMKKIIS